jgi:hypothetical protein
LGFDPKFLLVKPFTPEELQGAGVSCEKPA